MPALNFPLSLAFTLNSAHGFSETFNLLLRRTRLKTGDLRSPNTSVLKVEVKSFSFKHNSDFEVADRRH